MSALRSYLYNRLKEDLEAYFSRPRSNPREAADELADILSQAVEEAIPRYVVALVPPGTFLVQAQAGVPNPSRVELQLEVK